MNPQIGDNEEEKNKPEFKAESERLEISNEDLDRVTGGGNSAWGTKNAQGAGP
ncbi:MAG TPA: hypothetical protein VGI19_13735 [Candidatus Cybelea sp.]|jgi:hypothetical protein